MQLLHLPGVAVGFPARGSLPSGPVDQPNTGDLATQGEGGEGPGLFPTRVVRMAIFSFSWFLDCVP